MLFERIRRNFQLRFKDRSSAASILADIMRSSLKDEPKQQILVLGIPRGGIVTAQVFASKLSIPNFDMVITRKLTDPYNKEQAIGAITEDGTTFLDHERINNSLISIDYIEKEKLEQIAEIKRRTALYRKVTHSQPAAEATTILLDDGAATGATVIAAARSIRKQYKPRHFMIALPVVPKPTLKLLRQECDLVEAVIIPGNFHSVGQYYEDFNQVTDEQVMDIMRKRSMSFQ